jgi:hypothetical protein
MSQRERKAYMGQRSAWLDGAAIQRALSWHIARHSLAVAAIVGTILNAINQGVDVLSGRPVNYFKLALTYAVPFFVATYGAYSAFTRLGGADEQ